MKNLLTKQLERTEKSIQKDTNNPYKTLPKRIFAGLIDAAILNIVMLPLLIVFVFYKSQFAFVYVIISATTVTLLYSIITTKFLGGTLGKRYFNLVVLKSITEETLGWKNAIMREIINVGVGFINIALLIYFLLTTINPSYLEYISFQKQTQIGSVICLVFSLLFLVEILTALKSADRRSLHDYIGNTIVKSTGEYRTGSHAIAIGAYVLSLVAYLKLFQIIAI